MKRAAILLDTNVWLDLAFGGERGRLAQQLVVEALDRDARLGIAAHSLKDVFALVERRLKMLNRSASAADGLMCDNLDGDKRAAALTDGDSDREAAVVTAGNIPHSAASDDGGAQGNVLPGSDYSRNVPEESTAPINNKEASQVEVSSSIDEQRIGAVAREAAWATVKYIMEVAEVVGSDFMDAALAVKGRSVHDFYEDNLVVAAAMRMNADLLVTSDKMLQKHSTVGTLSVPDALNWLQGCV